MQISGLLKVTVTVLYNSLTIFQKRRTQIFFKIGILKISQISLENTSVGASDLQHY